MAAFVAAAVVYLASMAPGVLWGDSSDAQLRVLIGAWRDARDLARAHVTYYALARGLHVGLGMSAAGAANTVAALAGAGTVANVCVLLGMLITNRWARLAATALLLFSHTLWQLSSGAEVVTLSTLCLSGELILAVGVLSGRGRRWLIGAALVNGIGWSTHNLALLTWPGYAVVGLMRWRSVRGLGGRTLAAVGVAWVCGALPLLLITARTYGELGEIGATMRSLLVGVYGAQVMHHAPDARMLARVAAYLMMNFPTPLLLLAPWGWLWLKRHVSGATWWFLTMAAGTYAVFGARYNVPDQYTFMVHAYVVLTVFACAGIAAWCERFPTQRTTVAVLALSVTGPVAYAFAPLLVERTPALAARIPDRAITYRDDVRWFLQPWRTGNDDAARYARDVLRELPPEANLIADSTTRKVIRYIQETEGLRPDVQINGRTWRVPKKPRKLDRESAQKYAEQGLLFVTSNRMRYSPDWVHAPTYRLERHGLVYRVAPRTDERRTDERRTDERRTDELGADEP